MRLKIIVFKVSLHCGKANAKVIFSLIFVAV